MSWAFFLDSEGKPKVDLYCYARGKNVISEHVQKIDAVDALKAYETKALREAAEAAGQKELFG